MDLHVLVELCELIVIAILVRKKPIIVEKTIIKEIGESEVVKADPHRETIRHVLKPDNMGKHVPVLRHDITTKKEWFIDGEEVSEEVYKENVNHNK